MKKWVSNDLWHFVEVDGEVYILAKDIIDEIDELKKILESTGNKEGD